MVVPGKFGDPPDWGGNREVGRVGLEWGNLVGPGEEKLEELLPPPGDLYLRLALAIEGFGPGRERRRRLGPARKEGNPGLLNRVQAPAKLLGRHNLDNWVTLRVLNCRSWDK